MNGHRSSKPSHVCVLTRFPPSTVVRKRRKTVYLLHHWSGRYGEAFSLYKLDNACYVSRCRLSRTSILLLKFISENIDRKVPLGSHEHRNITYILHNEGKDLTKLAPRHIIDIAKCAKRASFYISISGVMQQVHKKLSSRAITCVSDNTYTQT